MAYSPYSYGSMLLDRVRTDAYLEAMRACIQPGMVVLDLGAGTGFFSIMACEYGASRVYALESNPSITLGPALAKSAGFGDRITFIHGDAGDQTLHEKVDVIIHDMRATLPPCHDNLSVLADARSRFLKPTGIMLPLHDDLYVTLVDAPEVYQNHVTPWAVHGVDAPLDVWAEHNASTHVQCHLDPDHFVTEPQRLTTLDYTTTTGETFSERLVASIHEPRVVHGMYIWFECQLTDSIRYDSGLAGPNRVYGHAFFPWLRPQPVEPGDSVRLRVALRRIGKEYIWIWATDIRDSSGTRKASFEQSSFHAWALTPASLRSIPTETSVTLPKSADLAFEILQRLRDGQTVVQAADWLMQDDEAAFPSRDAALNHVRSLIRRLDY